MIKHATALSILLLLTACANNQHFKKSSIHYCDYARRIVFSKVEEIKYLETETLRQIRSHNDRVSAICGKN